MSRDRPPRCICAHISVGPVTPSASTPKSRPHEFAATMASPLTFPFGMLLLTLFLQSILYGMGLLQVWLYFLWYQLDGWLNKILVTLVTLFETAGTILVFCATYAYLIDGFGDTENLTRWNLPMRLVLLTTYFTIFVAQVYVDYFLSIIQIQSKIFQLFCLLHHPTFQLQVEFNSELSRTKLFVIWQAVLALAANILITVGLCWCEWGMQSTNKVLNYLAITAVNRGMLTLISAALNLILFSVEPGTIYFLLWLILGGKLYMNSVLATLNTRGYKLAQITATNNRPTAAGQSQNRWSEFSPMNDAPL
ncbi:hypothetical protein MSAN_02202700 [Mycena sanguinolenta]|uniref:DUF6534 domain-containing protein n=1 Tax=Mycena sanguinolenta TaxID=230812 RepID=A0A8H7CK04_9AGAR|nr:hypothetical protein MSAN_02202700 [Mycena sanguinolenta]